MPELRKVGDKVVCINILPLEGNGVAPPLTQNGNYEIKQTYVCTCGLDHYDVGLVSQYGSITCYKCGTPIPKGDKIHWCYPLRFIDAVKA